MDLWAHLRIHTVVILSKKLRDLKEMSRNIDAGNLATHICKLVLVGSVGGHLEETAEHDQKSLSYTCRVEAATHQTNLSPRYITMVQ